MIFGVGAVFVFAGAAVGGVEQDVKVRSKKKEVRSFFMNFPVWQAAFSSAKRPRSKA
jgi:hypothetical protein